MRKKINSLFWILQWVIAVKQVLSSMLVLTHVSNKVKIVFTR